MISTLQQAWPEAIHPCTFIEYNNVQTCYIPQKLDKKWSQTTNLSREQRQAGLFGVSYQHVQWMNASLMTKNKKQLQLQTFHKIKCIRYISGSAHMHSSGNFQSGQKQAVRGQLFRQQLLKDSLKGSCWQPCAVPHQSPQCHMHIH